MSCESMWIRPPNAGVYRLSNPFECIHKGEKSFVEKLQGTHQWVEGEKPILFVHGMSYHSTQMTLDDLIIPFEKSANIYQNPKDNRRFPLYFIHWDSSEFSTKIEKNIKSSKVFGSLLANYYRGLGLIHLKKFLNTMEDRVKEAAQETLPFFKTLMDCPSSTKPWVISHSYGSMLWSEIARSLILGSTKAKKFGTWWSMQAAVDYDAYTQGKTYEDVAKIYTPSEGGIVHDWFSRKDIVLRILYKLGKRKVAAGEIGMLSHGLRCSRDVSHLSFEAHGNTTVFSEKNFFARIQDPLHHDVQLFLNR